MMNFVALMIHITIGRHFTEQFVLTSAISVECQVHSLVLIGAEAIDCINIGLIIAKAIIFKER